MIFIPSEHRRSAVAPCHLPRTENEHKTPPEPLSQLEAAFVGQIKAEIAADV